MGNNQSSRQNQEQSDPRHKRIESLMNEPGRNAGEIYPPSIPLRRRTGRIRRLSHSSSPPARIINLTGFMCEPGDEEYAAAAEASGVRNNVPIYWFQEHVQPVLRADDDARWTDLVRSARQSVSSPQERERFEKVSEDEIGKLDQEERARLNNPQLYYRETNRKVGLPKAKVDMQEGEKEQDKSEEEEMEEEDAKEEQTMTEYLELVEESIARAMEPAFTEEFMVAWR